MLSPRHTYIHPRPAAMNPHPPPLPSPPRHRSHNRVGDDGAAALAVGVAPLAALRGLHLPYVARPRWRWGGWGKAGPRKTRRFGWGHEEDRGGGDWGVCAELRWWVWAERAGERRVRRFAGPKTQVDSKLGRRLAGGGGGGRDGVFLAISEYRGRGSRHRLGSPGA